MTAVGNPQAVVIGGLERRTRYVFALTTTDAAGNRSRLSNFAGATTTLGGPLARRPGPGIAPRRRPSGVPVELFWRTDAARASQRIVFYDVTGRRIRTLQLAIAIEGRDEWNGRDDDGRSVPAGIYFARLISGSLRVQTRVVLLP